ncbi:MAG: AAA family ATPase [Betaproteobacteria bacterium]|nr:AAA family ATPase [Betaproteobacteria bacterium]
MILLVGGEKGGTGKSTAATNLAVWCALEGMNVILLDADSQGTSRNWNDRRQQAGLPNIPCQAGTGNIFNHVQDLAKLYEHVIIDAGGRDSKELRSAAVVADIWYTPVQASQPDLETLAKVRELAQQAQAMNQALSIHAFVTRAPTHPNIDELAEAKNLIADFPDFPELQLADSVIFERKVYRDAMIEGRGVIETGNSKAKAEIQLLAQEIFQ